eukprot:g40805.t1
MTSAKSIIKDEISEYLEVHGKIGRRQHSFIKERSCLRNLLEIFEEVMNKLGKGGPVDMIYLDFQKAFDKMLHRRLLNKIRAHGIRDKTMLGSLADHHKSALGPLTDRHKSTLGLLVSADAVAMTELFNE